jgi:ADP-ribosylglycohydrolase
VAIHGILSGKALENLNNSQLSELIVSDTIEYVVDIENPKFDWEVFIFNNAFFFGDNDSISAISASWYGAYLGIDKFPLDKIKELEFYNQIKIIINKLSK